MPNPHSKEAIAKKKVAAKIPRGPAVCQLCELVVQAVDVYLKDNQTEAAINATVYDICDSLPEPIKTTVSLIANIIIWSLV